MVAGIIVLIAGLIGIPIIILIKKGHLNLISGYNTMSKEKKEQIDRKKLKQYVLRILISETLLLIESGIVFIIDLKNHIAIGATIAILMIPIIGVIMYAISAKSNIKAIDNIHIILTIVFIVVSPIVLFTLTFI